MGKVFNFPNHSDREWAEISSLENYLLEISAPGEMRAEILTRMKGFFQFLNFRFELNFRLPKEFSSEQRDGIESIFRQSIEDLKRRLSELIGKILFERLNLEIELRHRE